MFIGKRLVLLDMLKELTFSNDETKEEVKEFMKVLKGE